LLDLSLETVSEGLAVLTYLVLGTEASGVTSEEEEMKRG
jgi:hypothetical protein